MSEIEPRKVSEHHVKLSDGTTWPMPSTLDDDLTWRLIYGTPTKADLMWAASIIGAYGYLLTETNRQRRDQVCRDFRRVLTPAAPVTEAAREGGECGE